jgi:hypothetical protein
VAKANPALRIESPEGATVPAAQRPVARGNKSPGNQAWARAQIRLAVEGLQGEKAPLAGLTNSQIVARCAKWMRKQGKLDTEIPSPRSFERYLPAILADVLGKSTIGRASIT